MSFKHFPAYLDLQKYWKLFLIIFVAYLILTVIICLWTNINNSSLEKKTGIIENIKINIVPGSACMWYIINIKMEGDPLYYVQEWKVLNNIFVYYFLFNENKFTKDKYFEQGRRVELYIDNNPQSYPYILTEKRQIHSRANSYKSIETPDNITTVLSYGLKVDNEVILDYRKRDFVTSLFERMSIGLLLLLIPLVFIGITYFDNIYSFFK